MKRKAPALQNDPLKFYIKDISFKFFLLDVGEGLMTLLVFPDDTSMLFDCNVTEDNEENILRFLDERIPEKLNPLSSYREKVIDIFVNSHRDDDHLRGLSKINAAFPIKSIWDSGQSASGSQAYDYYMALRLKLKKQNPDNLRVPVPSKLPLEDFGGAKIYCLGSARDFPIDDQSAKLQHTNSLILLVDFCGRKLLLTGDSDWKSWKEKIVPNFSANNFLKSNILIASHHGSRSFFTDEGNPLIDEEEYPDSTYLESLQYISPDVTLIPCGAYETAHHPNEDALAEYLRYTTNEQVYSTYEWGSFSGCFNSNQFYTVAPSDFYAKKSRKSGMDFWIECRASKNGVPCYNVKNFSDFPIGYNLHFSIKSIGGMIEPSNKIKVSWEVSNGGSGEDHHHQEIYRKGKDESEGPLFFKRKLSYVGRHLLKCTITNHFKKIQVTRIFVVNGIFSDYSNASH